jgi:antirestriction protein ArdC
MRPVNVASKKPDRGVNILTLWATAEETGYSSGMFGTYKQWAEAGAQVSQAREGRVHRLLHRNHRRLCRYRSVEAEPRLFASILPPSASAIGQS